MDFSFSEEHQAVGDLARQILTDQVTTDRLKEVEAGSEGIDRRTFAELAKANLLGVALPEDAGGSSLGFLAAAVLLYEIGRTVAPVPVLPSIVMGALPIAEWGTDDQKKTLLPPAIAGDTILTAALVEDGANPATPTTTATPAAAPAGKDGYLLNGTKICVPVGQLADHILIPATDAAIDAGNVRIFVVPATAPGLTVVAEDTTSHQPEARIELHDVYVPSTSQLGRPDDDVLTWITERATAAICVMTAGVCEQAVRMTAEYAKTREQFDKVIATFQAVGQRAADAYIDAEAVRLTAWQAAWRLHAGFPAMAEVAVAKFWAADGGQRVVHAAQHLHGGIGVDRDYPLHRYFLWAKHLELMLGGATAQLLSLGAQLAVP